MPTRAIPALLCAALVLAACGGDGAAPAARSTPEAMDRPAHGPIRHDASNASVELTVGSKNFTEQQVLGEIFAQGLRAAGFRVRTRLSLGDEKAALRAVLDGTVDAYPEYTGTALVSFFGLSTAQVPKDPDEAYDRARDGFARRGLVAFPPTPFTSSNELAVTPETAERLRLRTISDLVGQERRLVLAGAPECRRRGDCLRGLREVYGLRFRRFEPVNIDRRHEVLSTGRVDLSIVFTTDPQNRREGFVLLQDDKGMFPPYNSTLVVRREVAEGAGPALRTTIEQIQRELNDEAMQELNARVDLDGKSPFEVAREYLVETGLVAP